MGAAQAFAGGFDASDSTNSSGWVTSAFGDSPGVICRARDVRLSPGGQFLIATEQEPIETESDGLRKLFGTGFVSVPWPIAGIWGQATSIDTNLRTMDWRAANSILGVDGFRALRFLELQTATRQWRVSQRVLEPAGMATAPDFVTFNIVFPSGLEPTNLSILSNSLAPENQPSPITDKQFAVSGSFDGLVAVYAFEGAVYRVGSNLGRELVLRSAAGEFRIDASVDRFGFSQLTVGRLENGEFVLWDQGLVMQSDENSRFVARRDLPFYARPIMEASSGRFSFVHGPNSIAAVTTGGQEFLRSRQRELRPWLQRGWYIASASIDAPSGREAVMLKGGDAHDTVIILNDRKSGVKEAFLCGAQIIQTTPEETEVSYSLRPVSRGASSRNTPWPRVTAEFREIGQPNHRIGVWTYRLSQHRGARPVGRLIAFRGGPNSNVLNASGMEVYGLNSLDISILEAGYEIIMPEYSGARRSAPDVYDRLHKSQKENLALDAQVLVDYLDDLVPVSRTVVRGGSYGALPAAATVSLMANKVDKVLLVVPFGEYLPPESVVSPQTLSLDPNWTERQREMEHATRGLDLVGDNIDYNSWLTTQRTEICKHPNVVLLFGSRDRSIAQTGWRHSCANHSGRFLEFPMGHALSKVAQASLLEATLAP